MDDRKFKIPFSLEYLSNNTCETLCAIPIPLVIENITPFNHEFRNGRAYYAGAVQYRAKNGFGGYNRERATILIDAYNENDIRIVQQ
jgi:hypothetical protein